MSIVLRLYFFWNPEFAPPRWGSDGFIIHVHDAPLIPNTLHASWPHTILGGSPNTPPRYSVLDNKSEEWTRTRLTDSGVTNCWAQLPSCLKLGGHSKGVRFLMVGRV